jgi:hypothetical protein
MATLSEVLAEKDALMHKIALAKCDDATAFGDVSAADFRDTIERSGDAIRKAGESPEQARVRFMKSAAGRTMLAAARSATGPDYRATPPAAAMRSDPAKAGPASQKIHDLAAAMVMNESHGGPTSPVMRAAAHANARSRIRRQFPEMAATEAIEQSNFN